MDTLVRFVGSESSIGNVRVTAFGQQLKLDAETLHDCLTGHVGVIPEDTFNSVGLTEDELAHYADYDSHRDADPTFNEKKRLLHMKAVAYRLAYEKSLADKAAIKSASDTIEPEPDLAPTPTPVLVSPVSHEEYSPEAHSQ